MVRKIGGKDGLNSWVKILKENKWKNWLENWYKKCSGKIFLRNWVEKLGDKIRWKIV